MEDQAADTRWDQEQGQRLREQAATLRRRLDEAYVDKLDGVISCGRYAELSRRWQVELDQIERSIAQHGRGCHETMEKALKVFELTQDLADTHVMKNHLIGEGSSTRCV